MADDDFLEPDVPDYGDEDEYPRARGVDEELPAGEQDEGTGAVAPEEHIGLTPPD